MPPPQNLWARTAPDSKVGKAFQNHAAATEKNMIAKFDRHVTGTTNAAVDAECSVYSGLSLYSCHVCNPSVHLLYSVQHLRNKLIITMGCLLSICA